MKKYHYEQVVEVLCINPKCEDHYEVINTINGFTPQPDQGLNTIAEVIEWFCENWHGNHDEETDTCKKCGELGDTNPARRRVYERTRKGKGRKT